MKLIRICNTVINFRTFSSSPTFISCFSLSLIPPKFVSYHKSIHMSFPYKFAYARYLVLIIT